MNTSAPHHMPAHSGLPQDVEALNTSQWINYLLLLWKYETQEIDLHELKHRWHQYLSGSLHSAHHISHTNLHHSLQGFFEWQGDEERPATFSVKNKLTQYTWQGQIYHGPQDRAVNLSFGTFLSACYVYKDYTLTQNPMALRYLFAILYTNKSSLSQRALDLEDMPIHAALSAYYFFQSVLTHISTEPVIFQTETLPLYEVLEQRDLPCDHYIQGSETSFFDKALKAKNPDMSVEDLKGMNFYDVLRYMWFQSASRF